MIRDDEPDNPSGGRTRAVRLVVVTVLVIAVALATVLAGNIGTANQIAASPLVGKPAPDFDLPRIDADGTLGTDSLKGQVYVVNFWASWCVPCREENGVLDDFYKRWQPEGVELVGVSHNDKPSDSLAFREELGGEWPLVVDDGKLAIEYGLRGLPETFVVDSDGVIMAKLTGAIEPGQLDDIMLRLEVAGS